MQQKIYRSFFVCVMFAHLSGFQAIAQDFALRQLENSPRHHEWVEVKSENRTVHCFVAYPEVAKKAPAVLIIHENRGLTDWVRSFADQVAALGYVAIAPDLLSGFSEEKQKTSDFASSDEAREALYQLDKTQILLDLDAVQNYIRAVPASDGKVVVAGFCWGGTQTFRYSLHNANFQAALVFYGSPPAPESDFGPIAVPVYGFYGENDQRINATIPITEEKMKAANKQYLPQVYAGAGHAFMRLGEDPAGIEANQKARKEAWERFQEIMQGLE